MQVRRTTTDDPAFQRLASALDRELQAVYGDVQHAYAPFNKVETIATAVVALDAKTAVGCGCFRPFDATTIELKRMFVAADRRGRGIASAVIAELEAWARELGYRAAVLETGNLQDAAIALYQRRGYTIGEPFGPYAAMPASVCMSKTL